jgi:hypothetical protein
MTQVVRLHPFSFAAGAATVLAILGAPYVTPVAARFLLALLDAESHPGIRFAAYVTCTVLTIFAAWSCLVRPRRLGRGIDGVDALAERSRKAFAFMSAPRYEPPLLSVQEWLFSQVGSPPCTDENVCRALERQLTRPWNGIRAEPVHRQALLTLFSLRKVSCSEAIAGAGAGAGDGYKQLRDALAARLREAPMEKAMDILADMSDYIASTLNAMPAAAQFIGSMSARHGWSETVLMACLDSAREGGTLVEAEFGWLMEVDRPLALALNSVGRPSVLPEALGVFCHWHEERRCGKPLLQPEVGAALRGIQAEARNWGGDGQRGGFPQEGR